MATITEDYVSFEVAKLLKKKGFNEPCMCFHKDPQSWLYEFKNRKSKAYSDNPVEPCFLAPTLQMAMKWLREVHGLFISIGNDDLDYNWQIFDINDRTKDLDPTCLTESYAGYRKYEQAAEAAIKYCLEHLI